MATIVRATLPPDQFALSETLRGVPTAEFEVVRLSAGRGERVVSYLWATASDEEDLEGLPRAIEADPSAGEASVISEVDGDYLLRAAWDADTSVIRHVLVEEGATILDARGGRTGWQFRMLFPEHRSVASTYDFCEDHGIGLDLGQISQLSGAFRRGKFGLTRDQYDAILGAYREGYYSVPRTVKLAELADTFDVSHQALSERLRRGHERLVASVIGPEGEGPLTDA